MRAHRAGPEGPAVRSQVISVRFEWLMILVAVLGLAGCRSAPEAAGYLDQIVQARAAKDQTFSTSSDSPIPPNRRDEMLPLSYFPPDPEYRVAAALRVDPGQRPVIDMPTSTGQMRKMERVGVLAFSLKGHALKLSAFVEAGTGVDRLFVPFSDMTTGTETYAAGRYLDLDRTPTGIYDLDFNRAYHPFCYFDSRYDCPYPPAENRLAVPVRAGERLPKT